MQCFKNPVLQNRVFKILYFSELMRNTTKLKILLQKYQITLDMDVDEQFTMLLTDKDSGKVHKLEGKSYSIVIARAYSHLLRVLKKPLEYQ